jgi:hypothetical protein
MRQKQSEIENIMRENRNLFGEIDYKQISYKEITQENNNLIELLTLRERQAIQMKA